MKPSHSRLQAPEAHAKQTPTQPLLRDPAAGISLSPPCQQQVMAGPAQAAASAPQVLSPGTIGCWQEPGPSRASSARARCWQWQDHVQAWGGLRWGHTAGLVLGHHPRGPWGLESCSLPALPWPALGAKSLAASVRQARVAGRQVLTSGLPTEARELPCSMWKALFPDPSTQTCRKGSWVSSWHSAALKATVRLLHFRYK